DHVEDFTYSLHGTPCEDVFRGGESIYLSGVRERFPEDAWLREIGAESYRAVPLYDSRGTPLGHLGVLHDKPMSDAFSRDPILRIFAARAGAEVERKRTEEALARQAELEKIIGAISKRFIDVAPGEIDGAIDDALRLIGTFSGADRSYLFRFSPDLREVDNSNVWHAEGVPLLVDPIRHARARNFPWALRKLEKFETMRIDRVADMPPEAASEKAEMEFRGIRSMLGVPIVSRNQLMGFIGFSAIRTEWVWDDQTVRMLELLSETMANALARDRAEGKFKQLSHQNQLILSAAGEGIYGTDTEGRATFVNPAAARMCGWEAEELIGKPMHEILHHTRPDGTPYPMEECPIAETLRKGVVQRIDNELFWKKDGTTFPAEYIATPIREEGRISGVVITFNDITPRKRAEEFRYQAQLLSQVPDAVLVLADRGEISFWSKGAEGLTGYAPDAVAGRSFDFILAEGDPGGGMAAISAHLSGMGPNQQYRGEHLIRRADGQTRLIALHLQPSPELEGRQPGWIGIAQDVTEARGIQEEMVQAQRLAEVGTLAAGVAHEINNPLTVLSGNIQLLLERGSGEDPERPRFEQMKTVCDRISNVVNALSRITAHGGEQWVFADPNDVVEETLLLIEQLHAPKGVRLVRRYGRDLPNLRLLQNGLQQVMMNIVMNAIDAVKDDGEVIVETSRIDPPQAAEAGKSAAGASAGIGPKVCIRVTDTGHGIPNEALPRLFLPFFTTKEPGKGTGLGLAVARSIVSIHRGVIDVESRVGTGTTFTIVLPAS
ncbi:MAG: PAS domain S-box protein, partial [Myxococcota bacterium]